MLSLLRIKNIALIDELGVEFGPGLNLLTGETGSGKSIIVDSLNALTGERVTSDLIKEGSESAKIEGLFTLQISKPLFKILDEGGIEIDSGGEVDLIVRRELSVSGRNRIFINNQLITAAVLKRIGPFLVDIHGQGEHSSLFDPASHIELLDAFAGVGTERAKAGDAFGEWKEAKNELDELRRDEADKLQLADILKFQVDELSRAGLQIGESEELEEEKLRLNNVEKLSKLSTDAFFALYEMDGSTVATLSQAIHRIKELAKFDPRFREYIDGLESAAALLEDVSFTLRDFRSGLESSPDRLEQIESRLAEITRVSRKYGGTVELVIVHFAESEKRLANIELSELRERELNAILAEKRDKYVAAATALSSKRKVAAKKFEREVESNLKAVALEKAKFEVHFADGEERDFTSNGFDRIEFYFSANPGESPKPIARVASGGEASRLMLILKTSGRSIADGTSAVFDEIDAGIGGRVAEAVGLKLKSLAEGQQVLCVTHQAQVASKADRHFVVEKAIVKNKTTIGIRELDKAERIEEIARMLAGEKITDAARENAREMLAVAG